LVGIGASFVVIAGPVELLHDYQHDLSSGLFGIGGIEAHEQMRRLVLRVRDIEIFRCCRVKEIGGGLIVVTCKRRDRQKVQIRASLSWI
jgi:hypothetical protein